ncbi:hypothetical protein [Haladaptatus caseinilyticus]|uniref:hypothetical protein n=1 Tax=Haladaptatus caseinilyticus TaxID=2993314 RepID=UPI00224A9679|nr:hypothetical protein [Haladaptatus caseinilyticus]
MNRRTAIRRSLRPVSVLWLLGTFTGHAVAHGGSLRGSSESLSVPLWLFLLTGGGVVSASFLLASFVTDRTFIREIHDWRRRFSSLSPDPLVTATRAFGVLALVVIVAGGVLAPVDPRENVAILVVWVGWWAGYTATVYLVGNTWPALNPWRTIADVGSAVLPVGTATYPKRLGACPSVVGLLALVWLEVVSPLADDAELLVGVVLVYSVITLVGALLFGSDRWFSTVDPVARVFRYYGRVAPIRRTSAGFEFQLPGARLIETKLVTGRDEVAFVVAILWVTTYDGFVATSLWADIAGVVVRGGVPPLLVYILALLGGYGLFFGVYRLASELTRTTAETYLTAGEIARRFAPSLLPIAAGYHLAHYLSYFLSLSPALFGALSNPLSPPTPMMIILPSWFGGLNMSFVLLGHLLAVWVAHAIAYDLFPSRLQAIRSQYPLVAVMILYTMTSMWIVSQPTITPPYL